MAIECERVKTLVLCEDKECRAMYTNVENPFTEELLPCGHKIATIHFSGTPFKVAEEIVDRLDALEASVQQIKNNSDGY